MTSRVRARRHLSRASYFAAAISCGLLSGCGITSNNSGSSGTASGSSVSANAIPSGAQLGVAWSPADATLRPIVGVPGSAEFGASVVSPGSYANAAYSAQSQLALIMDGKGNLYLLSFPASSQPALLTQGIAANSAMSFSPLGGYAIVYAPGAGSATLISGLPKQPVASQVSSGAPIQAAAVSDAGTLLVATAAGSGVAVNTISAGGVRSSVATLGGFGAAVFLPGSEDILLADSAANTLARLHSGTLQTVATSKDGLNQPLAVASSLDSRWAVAANRADGTLVRVDLTALTPTVRSTCACSPAALLPLNGNAVFQLTAPGTSASWMIEADDLVPRVLFIPPVRHG